MLAQLGHLKNVDMCALHLELNSRVTPCWCKVIYIKKSLTVSRNVYQCLFCTVE